ncbi:hypothetical protein GB992_10580 [Lactobacillus rossiae]|uniref:SsuA/THI5-like domain-containing protein n=2 Tax=Lactobacillaceae TaxID=33958 RepID=A0A7C9IV61_9LACO|nr:hypothetical protein [Furfurilactobacillus milii]
MIMSKRRHKSWLTMVTLTALATLLVIVSACGRSTQRVSAPATKPTNINFAVGQSVDALPLYVAEERGYFTQAKLRVTLTNVSAADDRVSGISTHQFEGAISGLPELMMTSGTHPTSQVVGNATNYTALMTTDDNVTKLKQLKNKTVGTLANSTQAYATDLLLAQAKLTDKNVTLKTTGSETELMSAANNHTASAVSLTDPNASLLRRQGARTLAQTTADQADTGIVFGNSMLKNHEAAVQGFMRAYNQAVDYINAHPSTMDYQEILVTKLGYPGDGLNALALPHFATATTVSNQSIGNVRSWLLAKNQGLRLATVGRYRSTLLADK